MDKSERIGNSNGQIATYKPCWEYGCGNSDILVAFDDGIKYVVDILSLSLGHVVLEN